MKNSPILLLFSIFSPPLINYIFIPFYASDLGTEHFGVITYLNSVIWITSAISVFGINTYYIKYYLVSNAKAELNFNTSFTILTSSFVVVLFVFYYFTFINDIEIDKTLLLVALFDSMIMSLLIVPERFMRLNVFYFKYFIIVSSGALLKNLLAFVLIKYFNFFSDAYIFSSIISSFAMLIFYYINIRSELSFKFDYQIIKSSLRFGLMFFPGIISLVLIRYIDKILIEDLYGVDFLAVYGVASLVFNLFIMFSGSLIMYFEPFVFNKKNIKNMNRYIAFGFVAVLILTLVYITFSQYFFSFIFPYEYLPAVDYSNYLVSSSPFYYLSSIYMLYVIKFKPSVVSSIQIASSVIYIGLIFLLISLFDVYSFFIANFTTYFIMSLLGYFYSRKYFSLSNMYLLICFTPLVFSLYD